MNRQAFTDAKHSYQNLIQILNKTLSIYNENVPEDKQINPRGFAIKFDILLQHSLINVAISDANMFADELVLINQITDSGDIVLYFKDAYKTEITWEQLYKMPPAQVEKMLKEQEENMRYIADDFVRVVAVVDAALEEHDITRMLFNEICTVVKVLMGLDGEIKEDADKVNNSFIIHLFNEISARKDDIIKNCSSESKEECSSQSLEDIFNKKKR